MSATHPDRGHLDAETLAAWMDGGLDAASLAAAEAHVSSCDRCQTLVATMMKTLPANTAAPAGARLWRWWLAPIAAATAAVVIWAVVPQRSVEPQAQRSIEFAPQPASPPATAPPQVAGARENVQAPVAATPPPPVERQERFADASRRDANTEVRALRKESDPRLANAAPPAAAAPPPAAPAAAMVAESAPRPQEKPIDRAAGLAAAASPIAQSRATQVAAVEIISPDPSQRWRIINRQRIERTDDNGATWRLVGGVNDVTISAGSAPSNSVAWFAGNAGVVLLTTDGGVSLQVRNIGQRLDLAGVTASSARTATVFTADGRTFRTDDGGATWRQN